jgi:hypothetical protein
MTSGTVFFLEWQARYADYRIATFPVRIGEGGKVPAIRGWQRVGLPASGKLAQKFADADAFGFCPGSRNRLTILDVDTSDERVLIAALDRHGSTPIIVRSGSGNYQAWYCNNGEGRLIRPEPDKPIDILGNGFVVAPPSRGTEFDYQFFRGSLNDLDHLPHLRNLPTHVNGQTEATPPRSTEQIRAGNRNRELWEHCMRTAHRCDDFDALLDVARSRNSEFWPPLEDDEVAKTAYSAWGYTAAGKNRFGRPGVFFDARQANELIRDDLDLYVLLSFLRANNKPDGEFMATNKGLAEVFHWGPKRVAAARRRMIATGHAIQTRTARPQKPALYRWAKGGPK